MKRNNASGGKNIRGLRLAKLFALFSILAVIASVFGFYVLRIQDSRLGITVVVPLLVVFGLARVFSWILPNHPLAKTLDDRLDALVIAILTCLLTWSSVVLGISAVLYWLVGMSRFGKKAGFLMLWSLIGDILVFLVYVLATWADRKSLGQAVGALVARVVRYSSDFIRSSVRLIEGSTTAPHISKQPLRHLD